MAAGSKMQSRERSSRIARQQAKKEKDERRKGGEKRQSWTRDAAHHSFMLPCYNRIPGEGGM